MILKFQSHHALAVTLSRIIVCKPQSADCQRLISAYNRLKSDVRSPLDCETISDYLYVFVNMPPLAQYDPRPAVLYWLQDKQRRHKSAPKASQQDWLRRVFNDMEEQSAPEKEQLVRKF